MKIRYIVKHRCHAIFGSSYEVRMRIWFLSFYITTFDNNSEASLFALNLNNDNWRNRSG